MTPDYSDKWKLPERVSQGHGPLHAQEGAVIGITRESEQWQLFRYRNKCHLSGAWRGSQGSGAT